MGEKKLENLEIVSALKEFLLSKSALVVDTTSSSRMSIAKVLVEFGMDRNQVQAVNTFELAVNKIKNDKPDIIVAEYKIGSSFGLNLLALQKEYASLPLHRCFILATGNTSETAIVEALEEEVDAFLIKPFSGKSLQMHLMKVLLGKMNPSSYLKKLLKAKQYLSEGEVMASQRVLQEAVSLDPEPALAYYYLGKSYVDLKDFHNALEHFKKGLSFNNNHYKCLHGLVEMYEVKMDYRNALETMLRISGTFPLSQVKILKILDYMFLLQDYSQAEKVYQIFSETENRNPELIEKMSQVLYNRATASSEISETNQLDMFKKSLNIIGRRSSDVVHILNYFLAKNSFDAAEEILKMYPLDQREDTTYKEYDFLVKKERRPLEEVIEEGKRLILSGVGNYQMFIFVIQHLVQQGKQTAAETIAYKGIEKFPNKRQDFLNLIS